MKIKLNLLPKIKEKKIRNKKILKFIIFQEVLIIIVTLFFFGLIKGLNAVSILQMRGIEQEISNSDNRDEYRQIKKYEENIKSAKEKVNFISLIQKSESDWLVVFSKLSEIIDEDIVLESINGNGFLVTIKGVAKDRDSLIRVKKSFEEDSCFKDINIPLNDIVLKNDIDFELKFNVDEKCIKNYEK